MLRTALMSAALAAMGVQAGLPNPVPLEPASAFDSLNAALQGVSVRLPKESISALGLNLTLMDTVCGNFSLKGLSIPAAPVAGGGAEFELALSQLHLVCDSNVSNLGAAPNPVHLEVALNVTIEAALVPLPNHTAPSSVRVEKCAASLPVFVGTCTPASADLCTFIDTLLPSILKTVLNTTVCSLVEKEVGPDSKPALYLDLAAALLESWAVTPNPQLTPAETEGYLAPYQSEIATFSKDNKLVRLAKLADFAPATLIDWILPLILKKGKLTVALNTTVPIAGGVELVVESLEVSGLNTFSSLKPLELVSGYTWRSQIALKKVGVAVNAGLKMNTSAKVMPLQVVVPLTDLSLDLSAIVAFNESRICELGGTVATSSVPCALWTVVNTKSSSGQAVSGFKLTNLAVSMGAFPAIEVSGLGQGLDDALAGLLKEVSLAFGPAIVKALPLGLSATLKGVADTLIFNEVAKMDAAGGCAAAVNAPALAVSRVCVVNNAGFVVNFGLHDCNTALESPDSGNFPIDQHRCMEVSKLPNVTAGQIVRLSTDAVAGKRALAEPALRYSPSSNVATFECKGTTMDYTCALKSYTPVTPGQLAEVSKICVANDAGFVLDWVAQNVRTGTASVSSGRYPIDQTRCLDLGSIAGVKEGDKVQASVHAILGKTNDVSSPVVYKNNSLGATFMCTGTTLNFKCGLVMLA